MIPGLENWINSTRWWAVLTPCSKPIFAAVIAIDYETALAQAIRYFQCCRDHVDVELWDESKHGEKPNVRL
jgi:hypothetical protein